MSSRSTSRSWLRRFILSARSRPASFTLPTPFCTLPAATNGVAAQPTRPVAAPTGCRVGTSLPLTVNVRDEIKDHAERAHRQELQISAHAVIIEAAVVEFSPIGRTIRIGDARRVLLAANRGDQPIEATIACAATGSTATRRFG